MLLWLYHVRRGGYEPPSRRTLSISLCFGVALLGGLLLLFYPPLVERMTSERECWHSLLEGGVENVPYTSIGIRINTWLAALEWIEQRPLVGWGGQARSLVIEHTPWLPPFVKENFGHPHNYLLEVWVAYGLLGVALITTLALMDRARNLAGMAGGRDAGRR
ncbi:MAG: O-antigen ligase family protein [Halomonas sp.]|uniref:O-antigen ligase family protein n=1 Tax=Halomonas sp. TaxID=1486246 RepID=UPI002ACE37EE|nr:O-antigen ligase family protein [Halomonas sp.]MDZ7851451.1 O-antigen ligase family protein [Halomonas sp.]